MNKVEEYFDQHTQTIINYDDHLEMVNSTMQLVKQLRGYVREDLIKNFQYKVLTILEEKMIEDGFTELEYTQ